MKPTECPGAERLGGFHPPCRAPYWDRESVRWRVNQGWTGERDDARDLHSLVRSVRLPASMGLRRLVFRTRLAAYRVRPRGVVGLRRHPLRPGLFRVEEEGRPVPDDLLAIRGLHPGLRDHAPDGGDHFLVAGLSVGGRPQAIHGRGLVVHGDRAGADHPHGPGHAEPHGTGARDRRAEEGRGGAGAVCRGTPGHQFAARRGGAAQGGDE